MYRITATFTASAAGGTFALYQGGYNQTQTVAVDGTANQTVSIEFISDSTNNASNLETKLCFAGVAKDTVLTNMSYNVEELPRPVQTVFGTSSGGNSLTVTWAPAAGGLTQDYEVTLLNAAGTQVVDGPYTVTAAQSAAGYTFTGLTGGTTYTAKVVGVLNGNRSTAVTDTFTVDPWVPTTATNTPIGSTGLFIYNQWTGNTKYYVGSLTSLANAQLKQTANAQTDPQYYGAEAVVIPNNVAYGSCTAGHKYRITVTFTASAAGGTFALYQGGYSQTQPISVTGESNQTVSIDFVSETAKNTSSYETKLCFAGVAKDTVLTNMSYNVVEVPREVLGAGAGSQLGMTNAGGTYVST